MKEWLVRTKEQAMLVAEELMRLRDGLLGEPVEVDKRFRKESVKHKGRLHNIAEVEGKVFVVVELGPGEYRTVAVGSRKPEQAEKFMQHVEFVRLRIG